MLEALAREPPADVELVCAAPAALATYSGMVPGVLGRRYALREAQIDLRRLTERAGGRFVAASAVGLDAGARTVGLSDGTPLAYNWASFDIGSRAAPVAPTAPDAPLVAIKPIDAAVVAIDATIAACPSARAVVIGAGAGGCEVALALAARLRPCGGQVHLCDRAARPLPGFAPRAVAVMEQALANAGVAWLGARGVAALTATAVGLDDGTLLRAELIVAATGAIGADLFTDAGLPVDARGFLLVDETLRCRTHPEIFAAGDCATIDTAAEVPKSGVYAVRQGPILAANLRAALRGAPLQPFRPQPRALALLNTADGRAILTYGPIAVHTRWAWHLKNWIDRRFVRRFDAASVSSVVNG